MDFRMKTGTPRKFYSPNIIKEFDKHYHKERKVLNAQHRI